MEKPTQLHARICAACKKPILKGQLIRTVDTPTGPKEVHEKCLDKGSQRP